MLLAVLVVVVGVLDAVVLATTLRAVRTRRAVRRGPVVVALIATLVLIAAAVGFAVVLVVGDPWIGFALFG